MSDSPLVCTLSPTDLATRRGALLPGLIGQTTTVEWRDDGCRLQFPARAELLGLIMQVIDAERQCCQFLRFELTVEPSLGPMWLTLSGPAGTVELLKALLE